MRRAGQLTERRKKKRRWRFGCGRLWRVRRERGASERGTVEGNRRLLWLCRPRRGGGGLLEASSGRWTVGRGEREGRRKEWKYEEEKEKEGCKEYRLAKEWRKKGDGRRVLRGVEMPSRYVKSRSSSRRDIYQTVVLMFTKEEKNRIKLD